MGKKSRDKGARIEREIVNAIKASGVEAKRFDARRGQFGAERSYDIDVFVDGEEAAPLCGEIKARKEFPAWLMDWLGENDFLVLREDRRAPLVVVPWNTWLGLIGRQSHK